MAITNKAGGNSQRVLIDAFKVPKVSKDKFLETVRTIQSLIRMQPGFIEGSLFIKIAGETDLEVVTTAIWTDEETLEHAKKLISAEMQKTGINPKEVMKQLGVTVERGIYETKPY